MSADEFRVPKRKVEVRVHDTGKTVWEGVVYCDTFAAHHGGPQLLTELLNEPKRLLPVALHQGGKFVLLSKFHIVWIEVVDQAPDVAPEESAELGDVHKVEMAFHTGERLNVEFKAAAPEGRGRSLDVINDSARFLLVHAGTAAMLVNLDRVVSVTDRA